MIHPVKSPRKLIEVALPLEAINTESLRRKQKAPKGWPTSFHKWWAQRPLAAARAVIFGQLVNDPSWRWEMEHPGEIAPNHLKATWAKSRKRLFGILEEMVLWDNSTNAEVLGKAQNEIRKSWQETCNLNREHPQAKELFDPEKPPIFHDPFAGSGTIPLEAQRLGLECYASDLNPVAVIINKATIEIPYRFAGCPPVSLVAEKESSQQKDLSLGQTWEGATGLAQDVRYYATWIKEEAQKRIGHLYAPIEITQEMAHDRPDLAPLVGQKLAVVAWFWARTVKSPNPAFSHVEVPLVSDFVLSSTKGKEAYVAPVLEGDIYRFTIKLGTPPSNAKNGTKLGRGANFRCLVSGTSIEGNYIKREGVAKRMGAKLMAVVVEGPHGRLYLDPTVEMESLAAQAEPIWKPELPLPNDLRNFWTINYGLNTYGSLFTKRQLVALTEFSDLIGEVQRKVYEQAVISGMSDDQIGLDSGGQGATAYAEAIAVYFACVLDRMVFRGSSLTTWIAKDNALRDCMPRQALAMAWDFAEANFLGKSSADILTCTNSISNYLDVATPFAKATVNQQDAGSLDKSSTKFIFSTDPPYYDNISYADLSDFFYVWLRRALRPIYPSLFASMVVPKAEELVAMPHRHGSTEQAEQFFLEGMTEAMRSLADNAHPALPVTIYYAFKQTETEDEEGTSSTGWETFLEAVLRAGFAITGTWPLRTEGAGRLMAKDTNALASSIVLVCRQRPVEAPTTSRRQFLRELNALLPEALDQMTRGTGSEQSSVAPVDLSQAIIGPGMAVFSKYNAVVEADGEHMSVKVALQLINRFLAEDDFDPDTQFCLHWFEEYGWAEGPFGNAQMLSRAKGTSVQGMHDAGVLESGGGKVRLRKWSQYASRWEPQSDTRNPIWETLHHLIRALKQEGETGAGNVLAAVKNKAEAARQLAYRLYTLCERQGWAEDARAYNELITSWSGVESAANEIPRKAQQGGLFE